MRVRRSPRAGQSDPTTAREKRRAALRRYGRSALRNAINGAGYAIGTGAVGLMFYYLQQR